jgi:molecular chaperone IbpA
LKAIFSRTTSLSSRLKRLGKGADKEAPVPVSHVAQGGCGMRTYDFAPLFRSTVGFDRLFDMLDNNARPDWPPYNIERRGENEYRISMAIAGFGPNEIELTQQGNILWVTGQKKTEPDQQEMLHQGLAFRNFKQTFNLADHLKVTAANLENGLLSVELTREVPEQLKPRRIEVGSPAAAVVGQNNQPKLSGQNSELPSRAA